MKTTILIVLMLFLCLITKAQTYLPENLGANVNSADGDNGPVISPDGKTLYFWSTRTGIKPWYSELGNDGKWGVANPLGEPFNSVSARVCAISPDGNRLLVNYNKDGRATYAFSYRTATGWGELKELNIRNYPVKTDDNYFLKATLSNDGTTIVFPVTNPNNATSKYRTDLYVIFFEKDNTWSAPLNLGSLINHNESEIAPFLSSDKKTLYFSRNTETNSNDFDIYKTTRLDETWTNWTEPEKLGTNFNDEKWNADFVIPASGDYAYLASSKNPLAGTYTDIIKIQLKETEKPKPVVLIYGKVLNKKNNKPLAADISYESLSTGKVVGTASTNPVTGEYKIVLPYGEKYGMNASATKFISVSENLDLSTESVYKEINKDLYLVPFEVGEIVRINNIFFESGKSELKPESFAELNRLVTLMEQNPSVVIQINGHTDNVGSADFNNTLSQSRATSVMAYLISKGIDPNRMVAKGFGFAKPVASNDTDEGKQLNRRVEFEIVKK